MMDLDSRNPPNVEVSLQSMDCNMLRMFGLAAQGLDETTLTKSDDLMNKNKEWMNQLICQGLVSQIGKTYYHTERGTEVFRSQIENLGQALVERTNLFLQSAKKEIESESEFPVSEALNEELLEILGQAVGLSQLKPVQVFYDWLGLSMQAAILIGSMKHELHLATRYMDFRTAEIAGNAAKFGRRINVLHGNRNGVSSKQQLLGNLMANPRAIRAYKEITSNPNVVIRKSEIPFSFIVIDREKVGIEIVQPNDPGSFFLAFLFENSLLGEKLIWLYDELLKASVQDDLDKDLNSSERITLTK